MSIKDFEIIRRAGKYEVYKNGELVITCYYEDLARRAIELYIWEKERNRWL